MERQVIFRDRQEGQHTDPNNIQLFTDQSLQHMVMDAITNERMYTGLTVTSGASTEISVAAGRLWDGATGKVYRKDQAEEISVFSHMPVSDEKWLAVSAIGQEIETDIQSRDFLIDLDTMQKEPRSVAMEALRQVVIHILPGLESPEPQKPEPPTGYTLIAYVRLDTSGVQEVEPAENKQLMRLFDVWQQSLANEGWIDEADPKIASLISDLAQLAKMIKGLAYMDMLTELARDVAMLKDYQNLPDTYTSYGADNFLDEEESDTANSEYLARVDEGVRFGWDNMSLEQPALFNPYADEVVNYDGLILPAHTSVVRLSATSGYAGSLSIGQYQYQTHTMKMGRRTVRRVRYGPTRVVCTNSSNWATGNYNPLKSTFKDASGASYKVTARSDAHDGYSWLRVKKYWVDKVTEKYWYQVTTDHTINGQQIAQTILNANNGWLTGIDLYFDRVSTSGDIHLHICETDLGQPDPTRCLGKTMVAAGDLNTGRVYFEFDQPVFMEAGQRYAIVLTTAGSHKIKTIHGTKYTNGTIFISTDGAYFQGDHEKDFMMRMRYARFSNPHTTVELTTQDLSGGIADIDLLLESTIPDNTDLVIEYRKEGDSAWYPIVPETADQLLGLPALLHMRAVFVGSRDLMPGLSFPGSEVQVARPRTDFKHISTTRTLESASEDIDVTLQLENWDDTKHTCVVKLISGATTYTAASVTDVEIAGADDPTIRRTVNFLPEPGTGIDNYQVQIEGDTTTALDIFHVAQRMDVAK